MLCLPEKKGILFISTQDTEDNVCIIQSKLFMRVAI